MSKTPVERYADYVEAELNKERAALLGRYGARVEAAVARCAALADDPDLDAYRAARTEAIAAIDAFCFQRECIGLLDHSWVERIYPRPPAR